MKTCALCGLEFSESAPKRGCRGCPLSSNCALICCPNCGYLIPEEPKWLSALRGWWQRRMSSRSSDVLTPPGTLLLSALKSGQTAEIVQVREQDDGVLRRLMALGLLPGVRLTLLRRFPCFLLQVGPAQLALDEQLAGAILVRV